MNPLEFSKLNKGINRSFLNIFKRYVTAFIFSSRLLANKRERDI